VWYAASVSVLGEDSVDRAMERYAAGDDAAFAEVYDVLAPRLLRYARRHTGDDARAEDVVQQAFLQMHRARGSFFPGAHVVPWAIAITRRLIIDGVRRQGYERAAQLAQGGETAVAREPAADELVGALELASRMEAVLRELPESHRAAFELLRSDGLTLREAAETLGTTVAAVKLRAHRAYKALRAVLGEKVRPLEGVD
jgi:RNA polymerase sigma-70 factor, ECF subfamily